MMETKDMAETLFAGWHAKYLIEDRLMELLGEKGFDDIGWDDYDCSLEINKVANDIRLNEETQRQISDWGFSTCYVNHLDGWETHYSWWHGKEFKLFRGWRRRYVQDPNATTTNVIAGPPNPGYFEISYWPENWGEDSKHGDLARGYFRIVPDPLDSSPPAGRP